MRWRSWRILDLFERYARGAHAAGVRAQRVEVVVPSVHLAHAAGLPTTRGGLVRQMGSLRGLGLRKGTVRVF